MIIIQMQKLFEELETHFREEQEKTKLEVCTNLTKRGFV